MASYDYVRDRKKAPGMDASDLKCIELRRLSFFQDSNCCAANGSTAPRSPGSALKRASHKNKIPAIIANLSIQILAIQVGDRLPASTEGFFLDPDRIGNASIGLYQNSPNFQMAQHLVNLQGLGRSAGPLAALDDAVKPLPPDGAASAPPRSRGFLESLQVAVLALQCADLLAS